MNDLPGAVGGTVVCPLCRSTNGDRHAASELEYRCSDCGATFDASGARVIVPSN